MLLLTLSNITKRFDDQLLVESGNLTIQDGEKIGLVGRNGAGKTTLFNIIAGTVRADSGSVDIRKGIRIGGVAQEMERFRELSLYDFCFQARADMNDIRVQLSRLEPLVTGAIPPDGAINEFHLLTAAYEELGGYRFETEVRLAIEGIGFSRTQMNRPLSSLSGGERNRAQIVAALLGSYDLLLLDEPTNHLDINATIWLENFIASSRAAYVIVSHDRRFLQNSVGKIAQLSLGRLELFHCGYEKYLEEREARDQLAAHHFRHQQEEIARIEDFIRKNLAGQKTKQAQSRQKYLARLQRLERPRLESDRPTFHIHDGGRSFRQVIKVDDLSIGYDGIPLVEDISFELTRGDRVGMIGPNGCGKTTLLKTLGGILEPITGEITVGNNVEVASFDQELSNLNYESDVISELWEIDPVAESGRLRAFLARFGFSGDDVFKKVASLSGGEKTKLSLAKILYHPANLLIFDEPTNHLDIVSIEALESGLANYQGTLLVVSHDRDFLDRTVNQIFEISAGHFNRYLGNYSRFAERQTQYASAAARNGASTTQKASYEQFREESRRRSRERKRIAKLHEAIAELEQRLSGLEKESLTIDASDWERLTSIQNDRRALEEELLHLYLERDALDQGATDE